MIKRLLSLVLTLALLASSPMIAQADKPTNFDEKGNITSTTSDNGFDEWGYNRTARIFSGTGWSWCMEKYRDTTWCEAYLGPYKYDKLVMKWNAEWDRGNSEGWSNPPYDAWLNNQWNGKVPGGSDEIWHYKFVWVGPCGADGTPLENGGYCIWGQFAVIMSQGTFENQHFWDAHGIPTGYGTYP